MFTIKNGVRLVKAVRPLKAFQRSYRFGQRALPSGYHVAPKWFDHKILEEIPQSSLSVVNQDGKTRIQNRLFDEEAARQKELINRVEKITVLLEKPFPKGEDTYLMMNLNRSTPYDCAKHISEMIVQRSALALVDNADYIHMHQPLEKDCRLKLVHFKSEECLPANEAFWRACSMLLGSVVSRAFKNDYAVEIVSPLMSDVRSGSFVCDARIPSLKDWNPTDDEKRILTSLMWEETHRNSLFERLPVSAEVAREIFAESPARLERIDSQTEQKSVVLYRLGNYIDMCELPLISSASQIGSIFLSAVFPVKTKSGPAYRFQGIALPKQLAINPYTFSLIRERSERPNSSGLQ